jgi:hypothetical protein
VGAGLRAIDSPGDWCQTIEVITAAAIQWIVLLTAAIAGVVFAVAFKYALREACSDLEDPDQGELPTATVKAAGRVERRAVAKARAKQSALSGLRMLQAGFIAFGVTSIFIMLTCMVGFVFVLVLAA